MSRTIELIIALLLVSMLVCDRAYVRELSSYSAHEKSQHYNKSTHEQEKSQSPFLALASDIEDFVDAHEKTLIVLSTIAIALFTGTLWRSTTGLQDLAAMQVDDMKKSLRIAKESADTAKRTVDSMEDTARKELRAYVSVQKANLRVRRIAKGTKLLAEIMIVNSGKTIAHDAQLAIHIEMRDSMTGDFPIRFRPGSTYLAPSSYWNAQQVNDDMILTEKFLIEELATKKQFAILWGKISYEDAFKEPRESTFRFRQGMLNYDENGFIDNWDVYPCEEGNVAT